jgi:hypothetical protein
MNPLWAWSQMTQYWRVCVFWFVTEALNFNVAKFERSSSRACGLEEESYWIAMVELIGYLNHAGGLSLFWLAPLACHSWLQIRQQQHFCS